MIDEIEAFNAAATLAIARIGRLPFEGHPQLASEIRPATALVAEDRQVESEAFKWLFGRGAKSVFSIYLRFWDHFKVQLSDVAGARVIVNAPAGAVASFRGTSVDVRYDLRLGRLQVIPDRWAIQTDGGYLDDIVFFSEDGLTYAEMQKLVAACGPGTSITFVHPGTRCASWFSLCPLRQDFATFTSMLDARAEVHAVHATPPDAPVVVNTFGVEALRL